MYFKIMLMIYFAPLKDFISVFVKQYGFAEILPPSFFFFFFEKVI